MKIEKKILVIDDIESNLILVKSILKISHPECKILFASSGFEGIAIAQKELPDVILLDIFMPEMNGFETCAKIKTIASISSIPILMISAYGQISDIRVQALTAGADAIISKPFDTGEFVALVNVMLRLKKAEDKLLDYQQKLKKLNIELTVAEEKERRMIADYLHDGISQILSLACIKLTSLPSTNLLSKTEKIIGESVELIDRAITETRLLTYDLSPPILYELGFIPAIKWKLEQIKNKHEINSIFKCDINNLGFDNELRILLYRVISELLTNIVKHAKADLIRIVINKDENFLYISVIDNGQGFDKTSETKLTNQSGFGLFSVTERLDSIKGTLLLETEKGKGTNAVVKIPFKD